MNLKQTAQDSVLPLVIAILTALCTWGLKSILIPEIPLFILILVSLIMVMTILGIFSYFYPGN
jgi:hypothetical protein